MSSEQEQELIRAADFIIRGCYVADQETRFHAKLLARHYLATRRAEPVAITEEFWMSLLGDLRPTLHSGYGFEIGLAYEPLLQQVSIRHTTRSEHETESHFAPLNHITTRDQLLHLLAALGIEVSQ